MSKCCATCRFWSTQREYVDSHGQLGGFCTWDEWASLPVSFVFEKAITEDIVFVQYGTLPLNGEDCRAYEEVPRKEPKIPTFIRPQGKIFMGHNFSSLKELTKEEYISRGYPEELL